MQDRVSPGALTDLRDMFSRNLQILARREPSVVQLCRDLGINRTQFNRYLSGETHPRPDVLAKICARFDTDARILHLPIEDVDRLRAPRPEDVSEFRPFLPQMRAFDRERMPPGFYTVTRPVLADKVLTSLILLAVQPSGLMVLHTAVPQFYVDWIGGKMTWRQRRIHSLAMRSGAGAAFVGQSPVSEVVQLTYISFGYLGVANLYSGFTALTIPASPYRPQVMPVLIERVKRGEVLQARRACGTAPLDSLPAMRREYFATWKPLGPLRP